MRQRVRIFGGHAHKCMKLLDFDVCANVGTKKEERNQRNHEDQQIRTSFQENSVDEEGEEHPMDNQIHHFDDIDSECWPLSPSCLDPWFNRNTIPTRHHKKSSQQRNLSWKHLRGRRSITRDI